MKLLYIALCDLGDAGQSGIKKKIENQIKCFKKEYDIYLVTQLNWFFCIYHDKDLVEKKALLTFEDIYHNINNYIKENSIDCVYIRYLRTNMWMNELLKKLKKSGVKVIIEFPTIPYDIEIQGSTELEEDMLYRNKLKKYVKMSTNYNGLKSVFGIPSIPLHNGINLEDIPLKKENQSEEINLIAVATMNYWHGYDRLIKGLANYYKKDDVKKIIKLVLVGSGNETSKYQNLIKQNNLNEYVSLKGAIFDEGLDEEFNNADIAVGVLGQYRKNADAASPIKTKEYCSRGIPMILGHKDLAFEGDLPFIYHVANDDTDINIEEIIQFYLQCKENCSGKEIRSYSEINLTWDRILKPVKDYFNKI